MPAVKLSTIALVGGLLAFGLLALAGVLLIASGEESTYRLGLYFGVIGTGVAAIVAGFKADQAATQTNGQLDARIQAAVHRANNARRRGDDPDAVLQDTDGNDINPRSHIEPSPGE